MPLPDDDNDRFPVIVLDECNDRSTLRLREILERNARARYRGPFIALDVENTHRELPRPDYSEIELRVLRGIEERARLEELVGFMPHVASLTPPRSERESAASASRLSAMHAMMLESLKIPAEFFNEIPSSADMLRDQYRALEERIWRYGTPKVPAKPRP